MPGWLRASGPWVVAVCLALSLSLGARTLVAAGPRQLVADPYANADSQHRTVVEPDTFAYGLTVVMAAQVGRYFDGGASNIGWATSTDAGLNWNHGFLPGITKHAAPGPGPHDRVSDPVVAFDARHNVWLIASLALDEDPGGLKGSVLVSRSTDGGLTWGSPVTVAASGNLDKEWAVCDNTIASPFYGSCYVQWDDFGAGDRMYMSTSSDGGLTWGTPRSPADNARGLGGQPLVQPNGTVIVPFLSAFESAILAFRSTDGGASWSAAVTVARVVDHLVAGDLRTSPLPSAEMDADGKVYVVWQDCRFRRGCRANDIVLSTSSNGTAWSPVVRVPIDPLLGRADHFIPGLAVDRASSGSTARLALSYYFYPRANCSVSSCELRAGFISSNTGGASWSAPVQVAGPMSLRWLPDTSQGRMVGDYISTSVVGSAAVPAFALAAAPSGSLFDQALYTVPGLHTSGGGLMAGEEQPIPDAASDHPRPTTPRSRR